MPMLESEIRSYILEAIPDAEITIIDLAGDNDHYKVKVASSAFAGKSRVAQHKMVFEAFKGKVGGELHALAVETITRSE